MLGFLKIDTQTNYIYYFIHLLKKISLYLENKFIFKKKQL